MITKKIIGIFCFLALFGFSCQQAENKKIKKDLSVNEVLQPVVEKGSLRFQAVVDSLEKEYTFLNSEKSNIAMLKGYAYFAEKKYEQAIYWAQKALKLNQNKNNSTNISSYYLLGSTYSAQNMQYQSLYYLNKAGELLYKTEMQNTYPNSPEIMLLQIASKNKEMGLPTFVEKYTKKILALAKKNQDKKNEMMAYSVVASAFAMKSNLNLDSMNFYFDQIDFSTINESFQKAIKTNLHFFKAEYFYNAGEMDSCLKYMQILFPDTAPYTILSELNYLSIYSRLGKLKKADKTNATIRQHFDKFTIMDSLQYFENLTEYYIAKNQSKKAMEAFDVFSMVKEKYYNQENLKSIRELSTVLDLQQKDAEIHQIKTQVSDIEFTLKKRNLIITLISLLFLLSFIVFWWFRNQAKKRELRLENEQIKSQNQNNELEMKLLRSQINPHFMFNTLASIQSQIRQEKNTEAIQYLNDFSKLMRGALDTSRSNTIALQDELNLLRKYAKLQQLRNNNFDLDIRISPALQNELEHIYLPTLSLQPFVENAILHGFKNIKHQGKININLNILEDYLHIKIEDNGVGLSKQSLQLEHTSHAINIIEERLLLLDKKMKTQSSFSIQNRSDANGVVVLLKIPILEE